MRATTEQLETTVDYILPYGGQPDGARAGGAAPPVG